MNEVTLAGLQAVHRIREIAPDLVLYNPFGLGAMP
jgi:hypothetical protein